MNSHRRHQPPTPMLPMIELVPTLNEPVHIDLRHGNRRRRHEMPAVDFKEQRTPSVVVVVMERSIKNSTMRHSVDFVVQRLRAVRVSTISTNSIVPIIAISKLGQRREKKHKRKLETLDEQLKANAKNEQIEVRSPNSLPLLFGLVSVLFFSFCRMSCMICTFKSPRMNFARNSTSFLNHRTKIQRGNLDVSLSLSLSLSVLN